VKGFRKFKDRWGSFIFLILGVLFIIGFHDMPALWVPIAFVFVVGWILGERADRRSKSGRKSE
jgi:dolichol kinase